MDSLLFLTLVSQLLLVQGLDTQNALELACRFMKSNGLKFVTATSLNQPLLRSLEFSTWKYALEEGLNFRVTSFGADDKSMYHQDSYLLLASAEGN